MASAEVVPHLGPQLPTEIWRIVFGNLDPTDQDLVHLWLDCRLVSKLFKEEVEHLFATNFMSKTSLLISSSSSLSIDRSRSLMSTNLMLIQIRQYSTGPARQGRNSVYHGGMVCHTAEVSHSTNSPSSAIEPSSAVIAPRTGTPAICFRP